MAEAVAGSLLGPLLERAIAWLTKPSSVKSRLETIKAYTIFYPLYKILDTLSSEDTNLFALLIKALETDPSVVCYVCTRLGERVPMYAITSEIERQNTRRVGSLLYLPTPALDELRREEDIKEFLATLKKNKSLDRMKELVRKQFLKKFEEGDIQIPRAEQVIDEAVITILTLLKLKVKCSRHTLDNALQYYYDTLVLERLLTQTNVNALAALTLYLPTDFLKSYGPNLEKLAETFPGPQKMVTNPFISLNIQTGKRLVGSSYEEFKAAYRATEAATRR